MSELLEGRMHPLGRAERRAQARTVAQWTIAAWMVAPTVHAFYLAGASLGVALVGHA